MKRLIQMPPEVTSIFGSAASKFVDYLTDVLSNQTEEVQTMSALSFEKKLTNEVSGLRVEMAELRADVRNEVAELRTELKDEIHTQIAGVNSQIVGLHQNIAGLHGQISGLHGQISGLHEKFSDVQKQIADVHKQISSQTKWQLTMMIAAVTLYPIINQLVQRYL